MKISTHTHPRYIVWLKYFCFVLALKVFLDFLYTDFVKYPFLGSIFSTVIPDMLISSAFLIVLLTSAYFFAQNVTVTNDGLLVEFLWQDLNVSWDEIIEIKPTFRSRKTYVVLTNALTPFHRFIGLIYGLSVKPAFIIYPTISEYESLVETIKSHAQRR